VIFPEVAKLMTRKRMEQKDVAQVIGVTQQAASKKLRGITEFKRSEMVALIEHFKDIDPDIIMDKLFSIF
jgi:transcriptional regulator with XRE-family HTH domain